MHESCIYKNIFRFIYETRLQNMMQNTMEIPYNLTNKPWLNSTIVNLNVSLNNCLSQNIFVYVILSIRPNCVYILKVLRVKSLMIHDNRTKQKNYLERNLKREKRTATAPFSWNKENKKKKRKEQRAVGVKGVSKGREGERFNREFSWRAFSWSGAVYTRAGNGERLANVSGEYFLITATSRDRCPSCAYTRTASNNRLPSTIFSAGILIS